MSDVIVELGFKDEGDKGATQSTVAYIKNDEKTLSLVHEMLHTSYTVDEYLKKLEGLVRIFWGGIAPDGRNLDGVKWMDVMLRLLPTECLAPLLEESISRREGNERNTELWANVHKRMEDGK
jgi:hypothetical protein